MIKQLLKCYLLLPCMLGVSAVANAQQAVSVQQTDGTAVSVSLENFSRLSFSEDLQNVCLEQTDGSCHTVLLDELFQVSFGALNSSEKPTMNAVSLNLKLGRPLEISSSETLASAALYNTMGCRVATAVADGHSSTLVITANNLPSGAYILNIVTADGDRQSRKIFLK